MNYYKICTNIPLGLLILVSFRNNFQVSSYTLTDLAFEYRPHLDLHLISKEFQKENLVPLTGNYYTSFFNNSIPMNNNSSINTVSTTAQRRATNSTTSNNLKNLLPSSKPDMITSGQNLIPVKSMVKAESVAETILILTQISTSDWIKRDLVFPSLVVVWPEKVSSEEASSSILHSDQIQEACKGFSIASELIFVFETLNPKQQALLDDDFYFFEVYNINSRHIVQQLSKGSVDFHCRFCGGVVIRRSNFHGLELNVSAMQDPEINDDLNFQTTAKGDLIFSQVGFSSRILYILQTSLNFSVKAMRATDWGKFVPQNNSWVGSVKDVADGKANFGLAITTMRPSRAAMISFLPAADEGVVSAFFLPPDLSAVRDIFSKPFDLDLWAAVFSTWIVLAFFMILFSLIRKRYDLHINSGGQPEPDFIHSSFMWSLATACQQGWDEHPTAGSLRTIFITGSFTGVVAYAGYSAGMVHTFEIIEHYLSISRLAAIVSTLSLKVDPIQTPEQLLKSSLKIGIRQGFINEILQQNNTNDIMTAYQQKLKMTKEGERFLNITSGYKYLTEHSYAFISTRDNMYDNLKVTANASDICVLKELQILKHGFPAGHFTARNSPLKEFLRYIYVTIREPGISWKLRSNYTYRRRCLEASSDTGNALGPQDVFTAFMILTGGFFLSFTFAIIEKLLRVKTFNYIQ